MQELQEREKEKQRWRELLQTGREPTAKERTEHVRKLQFEEGQGLFAVAYSTLHKAACDGNVSAAVPLGGEGSGMKQKRKHGRKKQQRKQKGRSAS